MSALVLTATQVVVGSADLTPFTGQISQHGKVSMKETTTFGSGGYYCEVPTIQQFTTNLSGFSDLSATGINSLILPTAVGIQYATYAAATGGTTAGDPVVFSRGYLSDETPYGGNVGDVAKFNMAMTSDTAMVGGFVLAPLVLRGAFTGTSVTMAGPTATQRVYAALFVTGAVGTNLAVTIESAPASNFASPTTRFTFTTVSAVGWQWATPVSGAITDGFWRAKCTVGSSTFTWACHVGVLNNI